MVTLLPRLKSIDAERMLGEFLSNGVNAWKGFESNKLPDEVRFAPTGGSTIAAASLKELRDDIVEIAKGCGFGNHNGKQELARFDSIASEVLAENSILNSGESLRTETWAFIGVTMAPDIVYWRFGTSRERYFGGVRNTFQRLWMRGRALDRGRDKSERWDLLHQLTEDALVQITERPSIGGDSFLALAIAEAWVRASNRYGKSRMEPIMRHAILRIRIQNEFRSMSTLSQAELEGVLDTFFEIAKNTVAVQ